MTRINRPEPKKGWRAENWIALGMLAVAVATVIVLIVKD